MTDREYAGARTMADLEAEVERHRRANLVRALIEGYGPLDDCVNEAINADEFDRVPWLVVEQATAEAKRLRIEREHLLTFVYQRCGKCGVIAAPENPPAVLREFLDASIAVWREVDRQAATPTGYTGIASGTALRERERAAWHAYRDALDAHNSGSSQVPSS